MSVWTGLAMLAFAGFLIFIGCPGKDAVHRKYRRFNAALVLYPPIILVFMAVGIAAIVSELLTK